MINKYEDILKEFVLEEDRGKYRFSNFSFRVSDISTDFYLMCEVTSIRGRKIVTEMARYDYYDNSIVLSYMRIGLCKGNICMIREIYYKCIDRYYQMLSKKYVKCICSSLHLHTLNDLELPYKKLFPLIYEVEEAGTNKRYSEKVIELNQRIDEVKQLAEELVKDNDIIKAAYKNYSLNREYKCLLKKKEITYKEIIRDKDKKAVGTGKISWELAKKKISYLLE